jgi:hypothetical protein
MGLQVPGRSTGRTAPPVGWSIVEDKCQHGLVAECTNCKDAAVLVVVALLRKILARELTACVQAL